MKNTLKILIPILFMTLVIGETAYADENGLSEAAQNQTVQEETNHSEKSGVVFMTPFSIIKKFRNNLFSLKFENTFYHSYFMKPYDFGFQDMQKSGLPVSFLNYQDCKDQEFEALGAKGQIDDSYAVGLTFQYKSLSWKACYKALFQKNDDPGACSKELPTISFFIHLPDD